MQPGLKKFLQSWLINTLSVLVAVAVLPGINFKSDSLLTPFITSLVLGVLNALVRPMLMYLAWPLLILSMGLFLLVVNAAVLYIVGLLLGDYFEVRSFGSAFLGALIISIVSTVLNIVTGTGNSRIIVRRQQRPRDQDRGDGPVIDI